MAAVKWFRATILHNSVGAVVVARSSNAVHPLLAELPGSRLRLNVNIFLWDSAIKRSKVH